MQFWSRPSNSPPIVQLPQGMVEGHRPPSVYNQRYLSFEGLPYAAAPVNDLRFRPPQPPPSWNDVRLCTKPGNKPMQRNPITNQVEGSEDCLYLNVYTRQLYTDEKLPVFVFIHGYFFKNSDGCCDICGPEYFMFRNVILVTFNYRLGCLGFLSLQKKSVDVPGNNGFHDILAALTWVKKNIVHFNGNSENITIIGHGAGAVAAHYMMCIPRAEGLFQKAVLISGCILNYWASLPPNDFAYRLAKLNGFDSGDDDKEVLMYLKQAPAEDLVKRKLLMPPDLKEGFLYPFGPVVEPYESPNTLISNTPIKLLSTAWGNKIPLIIGGCSFEGSIMYRYVKLYPGLVSNLIEYPDSALPEDITQAYTEEYCLQLVDEIMQDYYLKETNRQTKNETLLNFLYLMCEKCIWHGLHRTVQSRCNRNAASTYLFYFNFRSLFSEPWRVFFGTEISNVTSAEHGDLLAYFFYNPNTWILSDQSKEYKIIESWLDIFQSFALDGVPKCSTLKKGKWKSMRKNDFFTALSFDENCSIIELPNKTKLKLWNKCYLDGELW